MQSRAFQADELEQIWIRYQLDVAGLRPALGPLYMAAGLGRRAHTFVHGSEPPQIGVRAIMGPTAQAPNGVPDVWQDVSRGSYSGRVVSTAAASTILIMLDSAIQGLANELGMPAGDSMRAGDDITFSLSPNPIKASTLIWAGANNVRHVDEWYRSRASFQNPVTAVERRRRNVQEASMIPIASALGIPLPVVENVSYEVFHLLTMISDSQGSYDRIELHALRVGQDLIGRAGLNNAPIGVNVLESVDRSNIPIKGNVTISDGIARSASAVSDVHNIFNLKPLSTEEEP